jgi:hypothetical protein
MVKSETPAEVGGRYFFLYCIKYLESDKFSGRSASVLLDLEV